MQDNHTGVLNGFKPFLPIEFQCNLWNSSYITKFIVEPKKIINPQKNDQIIKIIYNKKEYSVRVLKFKLDSGIEEILLTNLFDKSFTIDEFKSLYFMRWGIEVKYDELKNRLEIENFSGTTKNAIEQDFYASIYLSNMIELAKKDSDEIIK